MKKYWYKVFYIECPVCGKYSTEKERIYGRKPKDHSKIYFYEWDNSCAYSDTI